MESCDCHNAMEYQNTQQDGSVGGGSVGGGGVGVGGGVGRKVR